MEKQRLLCLTDASSSDSPLHSSTFHTTHSDIDKKMKSIVTLLEEDGHYRNRNLEIKYMLEEYNRSYQSLAEKYDCLKFIFVNTLYSASSSSSDAEIFRCNFKSPDAKSAAIGGTGSLKYNYDIFSNEFLIKLRDELVVSSKLCTQNSDKIVVSDHTMYGRIRGHDEIDNTEIKMNELEIRQVKEVHPSVAIDRWESRWNELNSQVTMLMEENLQHQEELTRRNNDKREAIKELQQQIRCLKSEKSALQSSLRFTKEKLKPYRSPISRLAATISNKLLKRGCS
ncbi:uncharacterized protein LOC120070255 isoform X2 [Benincasa hispida]|uniref:uncharacterized protein LOC120070255 isoform X2 n=1 Tax=Benincasa hispida TaxID=102211 RepID=UPI0018FF2360|nr:uncharacterized protein LOC120070255 isoform X2 [Benincasa hispida]